MFFPQLRRAGRSADKRFFVTMVATVCFLAASFLGACSDEPTSGDSDPSGDIGANIENDTASIDVGGGNNDAGAADSGTAPADTSSTDSGSNDTSATDTGDVAADAGPVDAGGCVNHSDCPKPKNDCRVARCDKDIGCYEKVKPDGAVCDDGDKCTKTDVCDQGDCSAGKKVTCDDKDDCTVDVCDGNTGKCAFKPAKDGKTCDDGNAATANDVCKVGKDGKATCVGEKVGCQKSADCKDDGNLCNGVLYCDKTKKPAACAVNPTTIVKCASNKDTTCSKSMCAEKTGKCAMTPVPDGMACDDGQKCTSGDACKAGKCSAGKLVCCKEDADCASAEDGDPCNGTLFCEKASGKCQLNPLTVVKCSVVMDTSCSKNLCDKKTAQCEMTPVAEGKSCNADGNSCTPNDTCKKGKCLRDSKNVCECKEDKDCAGKGDGDLCNGTLFCDKSGAKPKCRVNEATRIRCKTVDDTLCAGNRCNPKTGACAFIPLPGAATCDYDGNACTSQDHCEKGVCVGVNKVTCQCQKDSDCAAWENGNKCDGTLFCDIGSKECRLNPATVVGCKTVDDGLCEATRCEKKTGKCAKTNLSDGTSCDADGNACTHNDTCKTGACKAGANTCQCQQDADCSKLEDGSLCNGTLVCDAKTKRCAVNQATVVKCSAWQDTACNKSRCDPKTGKCALKAVNQYKSCNADDNACTPYDTCDGGKCVAGTNICQCQVDKECGKFDDNNACTAPLWCDKKGGKPPYVCEPTPGKTVTCKAGSGCTTQRCDAKDGKCKAANYGDGKPCDDGDKCSQIDVCKTGACLGLDPVKCTNKGCAKSTCNKLTGKCETPASGDPCDDKNPCTDDSCDNAKGACVNKANTATCDDGNKCTGKDGCAAGKCQGVATDCADGNVCTDESCDKATGKCQYPPKPGTCLDTKCGKGTCFAAVCKVTKVVCQDKGDCNPSTCDDKLGCQWKPLKDGDKCGDEKDCAGVGVCKVGKCEGQKPKLWSTSIGGGGWKQILDLTWTSDAHIVGVGFHGSVPSTSAKRHAWWVRLDGVTGTFKKETIGTKWEYFQRVTAVDGGAVVAVGTSHPKTKLSPHNGIVARLQADGTEKWRLIRPSAISRCVDVVRDSVGDVAAVCWRSGGNWHPTLLRVNAKTGKDVVPPWTTPSGSSGRRRFDVVAALPKAGVIAAGRWGTNTSSHVAGFDASNKLLWERDLVFKASFDFTSAAATKDGGIAITGKRTLDGSAAVLHLDSVGNLVDWTSYATGNSTAGRDVDALADGTLVAAAVDTDPKTKLPVITIAQYDGVSLQSLTRSAAPTGLYDVRVAPMPGAGMAVATVIQTATKEAHTVISGADSWGRRTCFESGVCYDKAMKACSDKLACTTDTCDKVNGCSNANSAKPCADGSACTYVSTCKSGSCPAGRSRVGDIEKVAGSEQVHDVLAWWDGELVTAGTGYPAAGKSVGVLNSYGAHGSHTKRVELKSAEDTALYGLARGPDRLAVAVGRRGKNGYFYYFRDKLGPQLKEEIYAPTKGSVTLYHVTRAPSGFFAVGDNDLAMASTGVVIHYRKTKQVYLKQTVGGGNDRVRLRAIAEMPAKIYTIAGDQGPAAAGSKRSPILWRLNQYAAKVSEQTLSVGTLSTYIDNMHVDSDGWVTLGGSVGSETAGDGVIIRHNAKLKSTTHQILQMGTQKGVAVRDLVPLSATFMLAYGHAGQPPKKTRFFALVGPTGLKFFRPTGRMTHPNYATAAVRMEDGRIAAVGYDSNETTKVSTPYVGTLDMWGNAVCNIPAACLTLGAVKCDDKNSKTFDYCDAKVNKCVHENAEP